ncbi:hypothetical protein [Armatimonas sp.]|uniref:hypothetical protein n=1 Tax=Armatimonas sp. TaxID=1872638 RepID=UPI00374C96E3
MSRENVHGLTVFQPHAALIVLMEKRLETRDWIPGPESGTPEGWTGTLLIVSGPDSPTHDAWMWSSFENHTIFELYDRIRQEDPGTMNRKKQGESIFSSGCILGAVDLVAVYAIQNLWHVNDGDSALRVFTNEHPPMPISKQEAELGIYEKGRYIWKLENPRRLPALIPFVGRRRLFEIPEEILQQIEAQGVML